MMICSQVVILLIYRYCYFARLSILPMCRSRGGGGPGNREVQANSGRWGISGGGAHLKHWQAYSGAVSLNANAELCWHACPVALLLYRHSLFSIVSLLLRACCYE